jgi:hypothetical protein
MATVRPGTFIDLASREAITLRDVRGSTLRVTRGTLWLTQENDPADVILRAGDNWVVERQGATVLEAQEDALVWVVGRAVDPQPTARRPQALDSWRVRVASLFSLASHQPVPYY